MKLLLEDTVYDIPTDLLAAWINMTPKFREDFRDRWAVFKKQRLGSRTPTAEENQVLVSDFLDENQEWYYQLMFEAAMDFRATNVEDFEESYRTDMTHDELLAYAERDQVTSHIPELKQPIRIPVDSD